MHQVLRLILQSVISALEMLRPPDVPEIEQQLSSAQHASPDSSIFATPEAKSSVFATPEASPHRSASRHAHPTGGGEFKTPSRGMVGTGSVGPSPGGEWIEEQRVRVRVLELELEDSKTHVAVLESKAAGEDRFDRAFVHLRIGGCDMGVL
jgi:hypothetical protein